MSLEDPNCPVDFLRRHIQVGDQAEPVARVGGDIDTRLTESRRQLSRGEAGALDPHADDVGLDGFDVEDGNRSQSSGQATRVVVVLREALDVMLERV